jgi:hypothetical protein
MEMFAYHFMRIASGIGIVVFVIGAAVAVARVGHVSIVLQFFGACSLLAVTVMSWLPLTHIEGRRITPAWVLRFEAIMGGIGWLLLAAGCCWYWIRVHRTQKQPD